MAQKLTQKSIDKLQRILNSIDWTNQYIHAADVEVIKHHNIAMMPEHTYTRKSDNKPYGSVNKEYGSPLCGIVSAKSILESIIQAGMI